MSILLALSACGGQESANQTPAAQASSASASDTATASDAEKKPSITSVVPMLASLHLTSKKKMAVLQALT